MRLSLDPLSAPLLEGEDRLPSSTDELTSSAEMMGGIRQFGLLTSESVVTTSSNSRPVLVEAVVLYLGGSPGEEIRGPPSNLYDGGVLVGE